MKPSSPNDIFVKNYFLKETTKIINKEREIMKCLSHLMTIYLAPIIRHSKRYVVLLLSWQVAYVHDKSAISFFLN
jgi:hypothetical protein